MNTKCLETGGTLKFIRKCNKKIKSHGEKRVYRRQKNKSQGRINETSKES